MKKWKVAVEHLVAATLLLGVFSQQVKAQDPVKVDPKHYKVELENDDVRVLRIHYGPGEESVMHEHAKGVAIYLDDIQAQFTLPDGEVVSASGNKGDVFWTEKVHHKPKNTGTEPFEVIQVELKSKGGSGMGSYSPGNKSIHLFDLPEGVSEGQLTGLLADLNSVIEDLGYANAGYSLYKVNAEDEGEYRYFMEGVWPDAETYRRIHDSEEWKEVAQKDADLVREIQAQEIYRKVEKVALE